MGKKKGCDHFFVYWDESRMVIGNRQSLVAQGRRPQPDTFVKYRLPYCPACGEKHPDHTEKGKLEGE